MPMPRAVRNANPGNLRGGPRWKGLVPRARMAAEQRRENRFAVFASPAWGFRALAIVLRNYARRYGRHTVRAIVARFAPPSENDTAAYVCAVSHDMGVSPDTPLDLANPHTLQSLCKAIAVHESGGWFFSDADLARGIALAQAA